MKKLLKISLIASLTIGTSLSATTLQEALTNSKVSAEIKAQFYDNKQVTDGKSDTIFAIGGNLGVVTGSYHGFSAGVTFQTSHTMDDQIDGANSFADTVDASGSVMSESYLRFDYLNTNIKVGRQYITTPLIEGSDSRMIKQSFEGITIENKDIPDTDVILAYVDKYQDRTDGDGDVAKFEDYEDGAWSVYAKNQSIKNLTLIAQYIDVDGETSNTDKDATYLEAGYNFGFMNLQTQYVNSSNGDVDGSLYGVKASTQIGMFNLIGIYSHTGNEGKVYHGIGTEDNAGSDPVFTALPLHGGKPTYTKDTNATVGVIATKIAGVVVGAYYGVVKAHDNTLPYNKLIGTGGFVEYAFNKHLSAKIKYEGIDFDTFDNDDKMFRTYLSYKF